MRQHKKPSNESRTSTSQLDTVADVVGVYSGNEIHNAFQAWYASEDNIETISQDVMDVLVKEAKKFEKILVTHPADKREIVILSILASGVIAGLVAAHASFAIWAKDIIRRRQTDVISPLTIFGETIGKA